MKSQELLVEKRLEGLSFNETVAVCPLSFYGDKVENGLFS
jgi:hypothetical protein